ncbi:site-2 protease family protein [Candidatus Woesearchaeota archaeon]|nr:site-2 protease family protein [Candidatus Woesearchaeota archaeon]
MAIDILGSFLEKSLSFIQGMNFDQWSAVVFVAALGIFLLLKKEKLAVQKIISYAVYLVMYRTRLGLKFMDRISSKYRELVKLFGYTSIGLGFFGMIFISVTLVVMFIRMIFAPEVQEAGITLVLPFTNVPGLGYLSFWHWIISIFVLALIHEFSHGVVARAHNLKIRSSGFAVFGIVLPILPAAFVEPDEKQLKKAKDVVQYSVFAAGPSINIIFAFLILLLMPYTADVSGRTMAPFEDRITEPVGMSFNIINETLPAGAAGMESGMVITAIDGKEVNDYNDFVLQLWRLEPGESVGITADGRDYDVKTIANPDSEDYAFLGIVPLENNRKIRPGYEDIAPAYYWFKGLFKWLFMLNFFIGIANLIPLGIVDGGRMLQIALEKIVGNAEKAKKIWGFIGFLFFAIIILGLLSSYLGNPFSVFSG